MGKTVPYGLVCLRFFFRLYFFPHNIMKNLHFILSFAYAFNFCGLFSASVNVPSISSKDAEIKDKNPPLTFHELRGGGSIHPPEKGL